MSHFRGIEKDKLATPKQSASRYLRMAERQLGLFFWSLEPESGAMYWFPNAPKELSPMGKRTSISAFISRFSASDQLLLGIELRSCQQQGKPFDIELRLERGRKMRAFRIWAEVEAGTGNLQGGWLEQPCEKDWQSTFSYIIEPSQLRWYYRLFEATNGLLVIASFDGYFKNASPAWSRVLGYTLNELQEKPFVEFVHPEDRPSTILETAKITGGKETISFINRYRCKSGEYRWLSWNATSDLSNNSIYAIAMDITEMKETQSQLKLAKDQADQANKAKTLFLANMSHEILTPLNGILSAASLMAHSTMDQESTELLKIIQNSGISLMTMFEDLIDLSLLEANKLELIAAPFQLTDCLDPFETHFSQKAKEKNLAFKWEVQPNEQRVLGDERRIRQIVFHLLSNAMKFTELGFVHFQMYFEQNNPEQGLLHLKIEDSGIGVDATDNARIFEKFSQIDDSITRKVGGAGLGLAITKYLVNKMQGKLQWQSKLGQGSTFQIEIPLRFAAFS